MAFINGSSCFEVTNSFIFLLLLLLHLLHLLHLLLILHLSLVGLLLLLRCHIHHWLAIGWSSLISKHTTRSSIGRVDAIWSHCLRHHVWLHCLLHVWLHCILHVWLHCLIVVLGLNCCLLCPLVFIIFLLFRLFIRFTIFAAIVNASAR